MAQYVKKIAVNGKIAEVPSGSGSAGVSSFNGRKGAVMPAAGDYNAEMVGAIPSTTIKDIVALDNDDAYNSMDSHDSNTLYLTFGGA